MGRTRISLPAAPASSFRWNPQAQVTIHRCCSVEEAESNSSGRGREWRSPAQRPPALGSPTFLREPGLFRILARGATTQKSSTNSGKFEQEFDFIILDGDNLWGTGTWGSFFCFDSSQSNMSLFSVPEESICKCVCPGMREPGSRVSSGVEMPPPLRAKPFTMMA